MLLKFRIIAMLVLGFSFVVRVDAQVATGTPPYASFGGGPEVINLANLNSHITVPVLSKAGRGNGFNYNLTYDSSIWYPVGSIGNQLWRPVTNWGWTRDNGPTFGYITYNTTTTYCYTLEHGVQVVTGTKSVFSAYTYHDLSATNHVFAGSNYSETGTCGTTQTSLNATATDGSGLILNVPTGGQQLTITTPQGYVVLPTYNSTTGTASATDRNGNQISVTSGTSFYDTLSNSTAVLTVSGSGTTSSPTVFTYTPPEHRLCQMRFNEYHWRRVLHDELY